MSFDELSNLCCKLPWFEHFELMFDDVPQVLSVDIKRAGVAIYLASILPICISWIGLGYACLLRIRLLLDIKVILEHFFYKKLPCGQISPWNILSVDSTLRDKVAYGDVDCHDSSLHNTKNWKLWSSLSMYVLIIRFLGFVFLIYKLVWKKRLRLVLCPFINLEFLHGWLCVFEQLMMQILRKNWINSRKKNELKKWRRKRGR